MSGTIVGAARCLGSAYRRAIKRKSQSIHEPSCTTGSMPSSFEAIFIAMRAEPQRCCAVDLVHFEKWDSDGNGCGR